MIAKLKIECGQQSVQKLASMFTDMSADHPCEFFSIHITYDRGAAADIFLSNCLDSIPFLGMMSISGQRTIDSCSQERL